MNDDDYATDIEIDENDFEELVLNYPDEDFVRKDEVLASSSPSENIENILRAITSSSIGNSSVSMTDLDKLIIKLGQSLYDKHHLDNNQTQDLILRLKEVIREIERLFNNDSPKNTSIEAEDEPLAFANVIDQQDEKLVKKWIADLNEHLLQVIRAGQAVEKRAFTRIQDSWWPLKMKILGHSDLQPDLFHSALGALREKLVRAPRNYVTNELRELLSTLTPPLSVVQNEDKFNERVLIMAKLSLTLASTEETKDLTAPLNSIREAYQSFKEKYDGLTRQKKEQLCALKHIVSGPGLGFFCANQIPKSQPGQFVVNEGRTDLYSSDFISYIFYQLLNSPYKASKLLLKCSSGVPSKDSFIQVSDATEGISLRSLLGMTRAIAKSKELFQKGLSNPELFLIPIAKAGFIGSMSTDKLSKFFKTNYSNWLLGFDNSLSKGLEIVQRNFQQIKNQFDCDAEYLYENAPQLEKFIDPICFSEHFVISLITNPKKQGPENFTATINQARGSIRSIVLVETANAQTLGDPEEVRSILYLLQPMDSAFSSNVAMRLQQCTAEGLVFDWLVALQQQNRLYMQAVNQGAFADKELPPFQIPYDLVATVYGRLKTLLAMVAQNPNVTHRQLLAAIEPKIEKLHRQAQYEYPTAKKAFRALVEDKLLIKEQQTKRKGSIPEAATSLLNSINLNQLNSWIQVSLIGKALAVFPEAARSLRLPGTPSNPESRKEFFFDAVQQGHIELVEKLLHDEKLALEGRKEVCSTCVIKRNKPLYSLPVIPSI